MCDKAIEILKDPATHNQFKLTPLEQAKKFDIDIIVPVYEKLYGRFSAITGASAMIRIEVLVFIVAYCISTAPTPSKLAATFPITWPTFTFLPFGNIYIRRLLYPVKYLPCFITTICTSS